MRDRATANLSAIVVDDEQLARDELIFLLKDFPEVEIVATGSNGLEAMDLIERLEPDLVFLDVQMPGLDGIGVLRRLRERKDGYLPHIVFSTAFDQYAVEAFRLEALDYVLKPIEKERLAETIARAQDRLSEPDPPKQQVSPKPLVFRSKLAVRSGTRTLMIDSSELIYATIDDGVITLVSNQAEGQCSYKTLEELQADLDPNIFWRTHRAYVVNVNRIREVVPWFKSSFQVRVDDKKGTEIPVSRVQTRRLREMLKL
jgi:two-component system LytT family response regulator/two-component system response regulator LytT